MWGIIHAHRLEDSHMFKDTKQCKGFMDSVISINLEIVNSLIFIKINKIDSFYLWNIINPIKGVFSMRED